MTDNEMAEILNEHPDRAVMLESGMPLAATIQEARGCSETWPKSCWYGMTKAAITEIESGAIYGAPDRCAVCGGGDEMPCFDVWTELDRSSRSVYWHYGCFPCTVACERGVPGIIQLPGIGQLPAAAAILRARRVLAERRTDGAVTASAEVQKPPPLPPDPYLVQRERENSPKFLGSVMIDACDHAVRKASVPSDDMAERRRVLLGLERGPEPRIDAWICGRDGFDPRRR